MVKKSNKSKKNYIMLGANVPVELNNKIVERANQIGIPKSSLVILILNSYFEGQNTVKAFTDGVDLIKKGKI